jgi:hypothetical protein
MFVVNYSQLHTIFAPSCRRESLLHVCVRDPHFDIALVFISIV